MHYLSYISFTFLLFQCFNVWVNFLFPQKIKNSSQPVNQLISLLIPARNEEKNMDSLLKHLQNLTTKHLEIIIYDDESTDKTVSIVKQHMLLDSRIQLIQSNNLPKGWLGKNHACHQLSRQAKGNFYLFIDADVKLYDSIVKDTVAYAQKHQLGLLSIFPLQILETKGEKITVPIMNYILLTLLPLVFVRISPFVSHSAANGQFMLFEADTYKRLQPHNYFKKSPVEDINISRYLKKSHMKIACITGERRVKCRMYTNYKEALNGFTKNIFMFFGNQPVVGFLFWILATLSIIPIIILDKPYTWVFIAIVCINQLLIYRINKQMNIVYGLLLPIQLIFLFHVMVRAYFIKNNRKILWKGRALY